MEQDTFWTPVIFRKGKTEVCFQEFDQVIAIFVQDPGTNDPYTCSYYMHIGQHVHADPVTVIRNSRYATKEEYKELAEELTRIGYKLAIRTRYSFDRDLQARKDKLKETRHD